MDFKETKERFIKICREEIHRDGINELLDYLEKSDFFTAPASTKFHGAYDDIWFEKSASESGKELMRKLRSNEK